MLVVALMLTVPALVGCDVRLQGPAPEIRALTQDLRELGVRVGPTRACRHQIVVKRSGSEWQLRRDFGGPTGRLQSWRSVETKSEATFVILAWTYEDAVDPLLEPASNPTPPTPPTPPAAPASPVIPEEPSPKPRSAPVLVAQEATTVPEPKGSSQSPWSIQPNLWFGVDDSAAQWVGGGVDLRYRNGGLEAALWVRGGTSGEGQIDPLATQTRRNGLDLLLGGGPVIEWRRLSLRPRLAVGAGGVWAHRAPSGDCPQSGACTANTRQIPDGFTGVAWVPKALASTELGWRIGGPVHLTLNVGATFAPEQDFVPDYAEALPDELQRRAGLIGVPWVLGHGSLGLSLELP
jgi:hypothetical protein